jgi:hypothetical protein
VIIKLVFLIAKNRFGIPKMKVKEKKLKTKNLIILVP